MPVSDGITPSVEDFGGANQSADITDVLPPHALTAQNVEFLGVGRQSVLTRDGFAQAFNVNGAVTGMVNWNSELGNYLVWERSSDHNLRYIDISANPPSDTSLIASSMGGHSSMLVPAGTRLIVTPFTTTGRGVSSGHGKIVSKSGSLAADNLFPGPMTYVPGAPTEPAGAGVVTAGLHSLGYLVEHRSGAFGRPQPSSTATNPPFDAPYYGSFTPVTFTSAGLKKLEWVLNPTAWPASAKRVHVIMTTVSNPDQWFLVPGANAAVTAGGASSHTMTINISDGALRVQGLDITSRLHIWSQKTDGTATLTPYAAFVGGNRAFYIGSVPDGAGNTFPACVVSDPGELEDISADTGIVTLPNRLDITTGFFQDGVAWLLGPEWTFGVQVSGDTPDTWAPPHPVASIGTLATRGVCSNTAGRYTWVADTTGLYLFMNGQYGDLPLSHEQGAGDWARINWEAAYALEIVDDPERNIVQVFAPLDSATTKSHVLTWNYQRGMSYSKVAYAVYTLSGYSIGAAALVQNSLVGAVASVKKKFETWLAPSNASWILRRFGRAESNRWADNGAAVDAQYEFLIRKERGQLFRHRGFWARLTGAGGLTVTAFTTGRKQSIDKVIQLASEPGQEIYRGFYLPDSEGCSVRFRTNAAQAWFRLDGYRHRMLPGMAKRGEV